MKLKRERKSNNSDHVNEANVKEKLGKDWFADQYEKLIGKPLLGKEISRDEVLKSLQESTKYRWIPEAKAYKSPTEETGTVHYLEWKEPQILKCKCPDSDCTCRGAVMFPPKKIPRGESPFKSVCGKLFRRFRKPDTAPTQSFVQRLAAVVDVEASYYKDLQRRDVLSIRGAQFCFSRCIKFYGAGQTPNSNHLLDQQKLWHERMQSPNLQEAKDGDRPSNGFGCTVTTQTTVGLKSEFIIDSHSPKLNATPDETIMKDIDGTPLHVTACICDNRNLYYASRNLCSFDKLLNIRELLNMKKLKNRIIQLKQNMCSTFIEIKEKIPTLSTISTQCVNEVTSNNSSEDITIATPFKSVIIKMKKKQSNSESQKEDIQDSKNNLGLENTKVFKQNKVIVDLNVTVPEKDDVPSDANKVFLCNKTTTEDHIVNPDSNFKSSNTKTRAAKSQNSSFEVQDVLLKHDNKQIIFQNSPTISNQRKCQSQANYLSLMPKNEFNANGRQMQFCSDPCKFKKALTIHEKFDFQADEKNPLNITKELQKTEDSNEVKFKTDCNEKANDRKLVKASYKEVSLQPEYESIEEKLQQHSGKKKLELPKECIINNKEQYNENNHLNKKLSKFSSLFQRILNNKTTCTVESLSKRVNIKMQKNVSESKFKQAIENSTGSEESKCSQKGIIFCKI